MNLLLTFILAGVLALLVLAALRSRIGRRDGEQQLPRDDFESETLPLDPTTSRIHDPSPDVRARASSVQEQAESIRDEPQPAARRPDGPTTTDADDREQAGHG